MGGSSGGGGKGGIDPLSGGGLTPEDFGLVSQAVGLNTQAIHNRYSQLGLGVPSGSGQQAAATGTNLQAAGPSTMEGQDIQGAQLQGQALLGQLQNANLPAAAAQAASSGGGLSSLGSLAGMAMK
jgi:hypothetical protein